MHYGVLFLLQVSLILYVILKRTSPELEGPRRLFPLIKSEDLEWAAPMASPWVPTWLVEIIHFTC